MKTILIDIIKALTTKQFIKIKSLIAILLLSTGATAAEIRGRIWSENNVNAAPQGVVLIIDCGTGGAARVPLAADGSYSSRGLPANRSCNVSVTGPDGTLSDSLLVRTNATVVNFNAAVIIANSVVILLPR